MGVIQTREWARATSCWGANEQFDVVAVHALDDLLAFLSIRKLGTVLIEQRVKDKPIPCRSVGDLVGA